MFLARYSHQSTLQRISPIKFRLQSAIFSPINRQSIARAPLGGSGELRPARVYRRPNRSIDESGLRVQIRDPILKFHRQSASPVDGKKRRKNIGSVSFFAKVVMAKQWFTNKSRRQGTIMLCWRKLLFQVQVVRKRSEEKDVAEEPQDEIPRLPWSCDMFDYLHPRHLRWKMRKR